MRLKNIFLVILVLSFAAVLISCTSVKPGKTDEQQISLDSIAVLPIKIGEEKDKNAAIDQKRLLKTGAEILNELLMDYFKGREAVKFIPENRMAALTSDLSGSRMTLIRNIGLEFDADAVLIFTAGRYTERQGSDYSAEVPASVAFNYQLILAETGQTLCAGDYDETQQSLFENLFSFSGAARRGFKWIKARDLLKEGVEKKLGSCPYLK